MGGGTAAVIYGVIVALIAGWVAFAVLRAVLRVEALKDVAYLELDSSDIRFANPEYQKLYMGETRTEKDVDWEKAHWR